MVSKHTKEDLQYLQALPLNLKIRLTQQRIRDRLDRQIEKLDKEFEEI